MAMGKTQLSWEYIHGRTGTLITFLWGLLGSVICLAHQRGNSAGKHVRKCPSTPALLPLCKDGLLNVLTPTSYYPYCRFYVVLCCACDFIHCFPVPFVNERNMEVNVLCSKQVTALMPEDTESLELFPLCLLLSFFLYSLCIGSTHSLSSVLFRGWETQGGSSWIWI